ncbi:hypothetical protein HX870_05650 [Pseudomonas gingeri]|uniref:DUF6124 family protein n=1 Tax=Pseudomonas gingeri TaxID=117681 RepID=UPI0015A0FC1A|nr:hypothetical protein [Pseudomonas gingeri]NWA24472.1 hypothetical protein [Pseudomonas gingeri]NWD67079.1 hypothetical protein [Pseudomonas gingeri]NWD77458.1 hypothetical protein [Pseudomonas gingeri]
MFKVTPNPPATPNVETIDPRIVDRALSHYNLGPEAGSKPIQNTVLHGHLPDPRNQEDVLVNVYSILQSAAATAYEHADNQTGSNRKVAMGVVHLIELAQLRMDSVLDGQTVGVSG